MKASRFALPAVATILSALACGSAAETGVEPEVTELGTQTENLSVTGTTEPAPVAPATTEAPVQQAAPQHGGNGEIDGNKDCGGWCHYQCCGDTCTTGAAVACVANCIKFMCMPATKVTRL